MISHERIPNNVDLSSNKRLQRALEHWQPKYIDWWRERARRRGWNEERCLPTSCRPCREGRSKARTAAGGQR